MTETSESVFDVVVAGGGSAGCVLATRLTENPAISVCLIEAGRRDRNPWIHIPLGFGKLVPNPSVNWGYETEPEPHLNGRRLSWPRGRVLGGSGSINGLVFLRGAPSDYRHLGGPRRHRLGLPGRAALLQAHGAQRRRRRRLSRPGRPHDHLQHQEPLGQRPGLRRGLHAPAASPQPRLQRGAHRWGRHGAAQRAQRLALLDGGGLPQAQPCAQEPQAHDAEFGAAHPVRRPPCRRCRGRGARGHQADPGAARGDRLGRRHQFPHAVAALGRRAGRRTAPVRHRNHP